jgi:hypothetical protein
MTCCVIGKGGESLIEDSLPKTEGLSILNYSSYIAFLAKLQKRQTPHADLASLVLKNG